MICLAAAVLPAVCCAEGKVKLTKLPALDGVYFRPRISGNWIVACHNTDPKNNQTTVRIVGYNIADGKLYTLFEGKGGWPDVSGKFAAWSGRTTSFETFRTINGRSNGLQMPSNLMVLDLDQGIYYGPTAKSAFLSVEVAGTSVAYKNGDTVWLTDLVKGTNKMISTPSNPIGVLNAGGNIVVWEESDRKVIRAYNLYHICLTRPYRLLG